MSHLLVLGSKFCYKLNASGLSWIDSRSCEATLLGHATAQKGYKLWDTNKDDVVVSPDVVFDEAPSRAAESSDFDDVAHGVNPDDDDSPDLTPCLHKGVSVDADNLNNSDDYEDQPELENDSIDDNSVPLRSSPPSTPAVLKSTRIRCAPGEWYKASALYSGFPDRSISFGAATKGEESNNWLPAIQSKIYSIIKNQTWTLVLRTEARNILTSK